jgi:hypothetical protein
MYCRSSSFEKQGLDSCQKSGRCNCGARVTPVGRRQASQRTQRQHHSPSASRESFAETHESTAVLMGARRVFMRNRMASVRHR